MAGISKIYCIGGEGGFLGEDGANPIALQIWVGDADRQWLEVRYFDRRIKPIGNVTVIVPNGPDDPNSLIDACIAFLPDYFSGCEHLPKVREGLTGANRIDFDVDGEPNGWGALRREARGAFRKLKIWEAELKKKAHSG